MARAISPVIGVVLLTGCVVALGVTVGAMALAYEPAEPAPQTLVSATVDAETNGIVLTLDRGDPLDMQDLSFVIEIDGEALETQPTYGSQSGLSGYPKGPLHPDTDPTWTRGESTSFGIAKTTNNPHPEPESTVTIRIFSNDLPVAIVETTAE